IAGTSAGSVSGVMNMGNQIGGVVTASLTPLIAKHFGWAASFFVAAAVCAVGSLTWLAVDPRLASWLTLLVFQEGAIHEDRIKASQPMGRHRGWHHPVFSNSRRRRASLCSARLF